ncbi:MAG: DNA-binding protein [Chloroflexi bacterium]|nr:helix-turn-helix domain-containing protein [Chloroflexi bacterium CFX2]MCQ3938087.1 DNA-binding protein [Chloroflexota bacterium]MDL1944448.1 helix-turn-helix domain-containing protein [Chloroflexi bacterium CFX2]
MTQIEIGKRVTEERIRRGMSQEDLANESLLSLRTIQRIESGQTAPRGDTLKRLASALKVPVEELIDSELQEDTNLVILMNLTQLTFLAFPLLGIIIPLIMWLMNRNQVRDVDEVGQSILNFQTSWSILLFSIHMLGLALILIMGKVTQTIFYGYAISMGMLYPYNLFQILSNTNRYRKQGEVRYFPAFKFLGNQFHF